MALRPPVQVLPDFPTLLAVVDLPVPMGLLVQVPLPSRAGSKKLLER
jgi:hypothetical protein